MSKTDTELLVESLATQHHRSELAHAITNEAFRKEAFNDIPVEIIKQAFDRYYTPVFQNRRMEALCENHGPLIYVRDSSRIAIENVNTLVMLFEKPLLEVLMVAPEKRRFCGADGYTGEEINDAVNRYDVIDEALQSGLVKLSIEDLNALAEDFII